MADVPDSVFDRAPKGKYAYMTTSSKNTGRMDKVSGDEKRFKQRRKYVETKNKKVRGMKVSELNSILWPSGKRELPREAK
jgi:hypothetical protein